MDQFVVSARKYRPQHFNTVVGQSHITTTLKNAILQKHLAHAFLFCGPRGVGKTTCARILAKTINCEKLGKDGEACDKCKSCVSFNNGTSFSVHELDAASNNSVDDIRELIEQVRFAPQSGQYKVYIIDEVHMLSASAFNAFLKTLEEPPAHAIFILATTEKHKILPTILSRCQIFDFKRITPTDIADHLQEITQKEEIKAEPSALQVIAQKSDGCMRDALSILDKIVSFSNGELNYANTIEHLNLLDEDYYFKLIELLQNEDMAGALTLYNEIDQKGFEGDMFLNAFAEFIRNLLVCLDPRSVSLLNVVEGFKNKYLATASTLHPAYLIGALNILNEAELGYKQARQKKLHVEFFLIKLTYLKQAVEWSSEETPSKKKRVDALKAIQFKPIPYANRKQAKSILVIEESINKETIHVPPKSTEPIQKPIEEKSTSISSNSGVGELGALKKIREQIQNRKKELQVAEPLSESRLEEAWQIYIQKLLENNQISAHGNLKTAKLSILDESNFEVEADNKIQGQFIELEKTGLLLHLQEFFNNPKLMFQLLLASTDEPSQAQGDQPLSQRDQYLKMVELYPVVKELRDKLNLDLDY